MTQDTRRDLAGQAALVTGSGRRIGAAIVRALHARGATVAIHCNRSDAEARALADDLEAVRPGSTAVLRADLRDTDACATLVEQTRERLGRLDLLVNNASTFYPTPVGSIDAAAFDDLVGSNLRAPLFVSQAAAPALAATGGSIVNLADIHGQRPLEGHPVYCSAKAGLIMLTRSLARELAPDVRVNAVAPGSILWPEGAGAGDAEMQAATLAATPLGRQGTPDEIAAAVIHLAAESPFVTGQVLAVDGGRGL